VYGQIHFYNFKAEKNDTFKTYLLSRSVARILILGREAWQFVAMVQTLKRNPLPRFQGE
jgi:hypothetical protein